jgi:hypothetical protein
MRALGEVLVIGCGALAREIVALRRANGWTALDVRCLPAELHNRPERIAPAVQAEIRANRGRYRTIFVAYGDCGTGGRLDAVLNEENVERLPGAHCYEFFAGAQTFAARAADADERARRIAQDMGLTYELRYSGYGELGTRLRALLAREERPAWQH